MYMTRGCVESGGLKNCFHFWVDLYFSSYLTSKFMIPCGNVKKNIFFKYIHAKRRALERAYRIVIQSFWVINWTKLKHCKILNLCIKNKVFHSVIEQYSICCKNWILYRSSVFHYRLEEKLFKLYNRGSQTLKSDYYSINILLKK